MKRREATLALVAFGTVALGARAQPAGKSYRIGFLGLTSASAYAPQLQGFVQGLRELGYIESKNIVIEYRWADGQDERLPELAAQLVRLHPDVLVTHANAVRVAQQATQTIPIVMGVSADPVGMGLIKSLARPGGNTTGVASQIVDLVPKRLQLLKEIVPQLKDVAVLGSESSPGARRALAETEVAARKLDVRVHPFWLAAEPTALESIFAAIARERCAAVIVQPDSVAGRYSNRIAALALAKGLPAMGGARHFAVDGGLVSYGGDFVEGWRVAARFVDKILRGARPADLPVEQPTKFELVINLKTAKALAITIPQSVLLRADEVIQ